MAVKNVWGILSTLFLIAGMASAQSGRYAGDAFALGTGARAMGLGGAYVALSNDATAVFWNPAGLVDLKREAQLQHAEQFGGSVNHDVLSLAAPAVGGNFGIGIVRLGIDGISLTALEDPLRPIGPDNRPIIAQSVGTTEYAFQVAYARRLSQNLKAGGTVKLIRRDLAVGTGTGIGLDAGIVYAPKANIHLAAVIHNLTKTRIRFEGGLKDTIAPTLTLGFACHQSIYRGILTGVVDFRTGEDTSTLENRQGLHAGIEYAYKKRVAFRIGLNESHLTLGAGITMPRFALNLAVLEHDQLNNTYRISASVFF